MKLDFSETGMTTEEIFDWLESIGWKVFEDSEGVHLCPASTVITFKGRDEMANVLEVLANTKGRK